MIKFNEPQSRSIIKTLTIRVLFTLSHFLNGFIVSGQWIIGAQIAGTATIVNMFLFWVHERIWNHWQWSRKSADILLFCDGQPRTISKSVTWRVVISLNNFMIPYIMTGSWKSAAAFLGIATVINIIIYYTHERVWNRVKWGKQVID